MKDGTTHLAYKAEHVVDLETEMIVAAEIYHADQARHAHAGRQRATGADSICRKRAARWRCEDVVADKGYHSNEVLETFAEETPYRTYIPEPELPEGRQHVWTDKPESSATPCMPIAVGRAASAASSCSACAANGSNAPSLTSARRAAPDGPGSGASTKVRKRYLIAAAAHNLGRLMRSLFGMGTPRGLQAAAGALSDRWRVPQMTQLAIWRVWTLVRPVVSHRNSFFTALRNDAPAAA